MTAEKSAQALLDADAAAHWLTAQPSPLAPPEGVPMDTWLRRLVEACAWSCLEPMRALAQDLAREAPHTAPDLADPDALIKLKECWTPPSSAPSRRLTRVNPILQARPLRPVLPKVGTLEVSAPVEKLPGGMESAVLEAMEKGLLSQALSFQCEGQFEFYLNRPLDETLRERFGPEHPWTKEAFAARLGVCLPAPALKPTPAARM